MKSQIFMLIAMILLAACASAEPIAIKSPTAEPAPPTASAQATTAPTIATPALTLAPPAVTQHTVIAVQSFDLGDATLVQADYVNESVRQMPVHLNGLIAVPPKGENLPLAVVIHGSHGSGCASDDGMTENWPCPEQEKRHFEGFTYLLEALANKGYAAVAINANAAYVNAFGEANTAMRLPRIFDLYMEQLAGAVGGETDSFGVDLTGRVDISRIVLVGHSQGGAGVDAILTARAGQTDPADISRGLGPISAAVLVAPAGASDPEGGLTAPAAVILPACDRDLRGLDGQTYYERERVKTDQKSLIVSILLQWANHNRFNTTLPDEELANPTVACTSEALLEPAEQREFLAAYVPAFYDMVLGRKVDPALVGADGSQPAPQTLLGREVLTSLALPSEQRLSLPMTHLESNESLTVIDCPSEFPDKNTRRDECRYLDISQPGSPDRVAVSWNNAGGEYEIKLPDGSLDLTGFEAVHIRAVIDPLSELNKPGEPQAFSMRLKDGVGRTSSVPLNAEPALAFPYGTSVYYEDRPDFPLWDNNILMSSIRVPLYRFSAVDLKDIQSIALVFDLTESGAIFITDLEFLQVNKIYMRGTNPMEKKPEYVANLEAAYGAPSQAAFGSSVFFEPTVATDSLEKLALEKYKYFVGELWERFGEDAWMGPWKQVYARQAGTKPDIVAELRAIKDFDAGLSVPMILDNIEGADKARAALSTAFDDPSVTELLVYNLGDGGAMSGILITGRRSNGETTFLVFLLD